jgi:hypothetical protein
MHEFIRVLSASFFLLAQPLAAETNETPELGSNGLAPVAFAVANEADRPIRCEAAIAHWYSAIVGEAAPGASVAATLWSRPETGEVFLLNAVGDRMPIQTLWCGFADGSVSSRSEIGLVRRSGTAEPGVSGTCSATAEEHALACTITRGP